MGRFFDMDGLVELYRCFVSLGRLLVFPLFDSARFPPIGVTINGRRKPAFVHFVSISVLHFWQCDRFFRCPIVITQWLKYVAKKSLTCYFNAHISGMISSIWAVKRPIQNDSVFYRAPLSSYFGCSLGVKIRPVPNTSPPSVPPLESCLAIEAFPQCIGSRTHIGFIGISIRFGRLHS